MIRINPKSGGWLEVVCGPMSTAQDRDPLTRIPIAHTPLKRPLRGRARR